MYLQIPKPVPANPGRWVTLVSVYTINTGEDLIFWVMFACSLPSKNGESSGIAKARVIPNKSLKIVARGGFLEARRSV